MPCKREKGIKKNPSYNKIILKVISGAHTEDFTVIKISVNNLKTLWRNIIPGIKRLITEIVAEDKKLFNLCGNSQ
ncbi:MAG: hypothetical protein DRP08_06680 [Candidatus Aenigmatarchaeota archaeon]|nr:MAG: hypothetical protein DRP08_06680 [Candidatus Aenigmarchaeota archaeon]